MERGTPVCIPTNAKVWLMTTLIVTGFGFQPFPAYGDQPATAESGEAQSPSLAAPLDLTVVDTLTDDYPHGAETARPDAPG